MQMRTVQIGVDKILMPLLAAARCIENDYSAKTLNSFVYEAKAAAETLRAMIEADGISARDGTKGVAP